MSKIAIVYWSGTGNTEAMAELVAEGVSQAGGEAEIIQATSFHASNLDDFDAYAFGCPAMGSEELESEEFQPMWDEVYPELSGRKIALFGSYDWADGEWMDTWREEAEASGADLVGTVIAKDYPEGDEADATRSLGASLV